MLIVLTPHLKVWPNLAAGLFNNKKSCSLATAKGNSDHQPRSSTALAHQEAPPAELLHRNDD
jgi:hypothetical protein